MKRGVLAVLICFSTFLGAEEWHESWTDMQLWEQVKQDLSKANMKYESLLSQLNMRIQCGIIEEKDLVVLGGMESSLSLADYFKFTREIDRIQLERKALMKKRDDCVIKLTNLGVIKGMLFDFSGEVRRSLKHTLSLDGRKTVVLMISELSFY
jgi:hypothetical protein